MSHLGAMIRTTIAALLLINACVESAQAAEISIGETASLIRRAEKISDTQGWAADMHDVLRQHDLERSRENICAAIAIIDQESGFVADPAVPGLGKLSESALREKFSGIPIAGSMAVKWLESTPSREDSYMIRIRGAKTERDLDLAYRRFVEDMTNRVGVGDIVNLGLVNGFIENRNEIDTAGSMQVSVKFAIKTAKERRWLPMSLTDAYAVRDQLYTRSGGMYYGIKQLLDYETGYDRKIYRFADYNAGRYASRNAAFQKIINELSNAKLDLDGDLLLYDKDQPRAQTSATEKAVRDIAKRFKLDLSDKRIRKDLSRGQDFDFTGTTTYISVRSLYRSKTGKDAAFAVLPDINLSSPKIRRKMTTADFATFVNKRYQACLAR